MTKKKLKTLLEANVILETYWREKKGQKQKAILKKLVRTLKSLMGI